MRVRAEAVLGDCLERNLLPRRVRFEPAYTGHAARLPPELGLLAVIAVERGNGAARVVVADVCPQVSEWDVFLDEQQQLVRQLAL